MNGYRVRGVVKRYANRTVLRVEDLTIEAGRTFALMGPSGAGKSTLLRLLSFLEQPEEGTICFGGHTAAAQGPSLDVRRGVTMVFQRPILLSTTVAGNVGYGLWLRGGVDRRRVAEALERVGLSHLAGVHASTLSGGEAQRVALARALVLQPRVLLLDEPTAQLDPANVAMTERIIRTFRDGSTTVVIVTHNLFQARRLADDAALLIDGELVEAGPAHQLFEAPHDPRTAAFCAGTMVY